MFKKKLVIYLAGPSCSGKSSLMEELSSHLHGAYVLSYDRLKWGVAGYDRKKHNLLVRSLVRDLFISLCSKKVIIILDGSIRDKKLYDSYKKIARKNGYDWISVSLTTPKNVLLKRFRERVKRSKMEERKISITNEKLFLKNSILYRFIPKDSIEFDTSIKTSKEISREVLKMIDNSAKK